MNYKYTSFNESDTMYLAQNLESEKFPNMVICLNGDLGSGKTIFTKAFASSLRVEGNITSPTYNIIKEYDGELKLFHMDVYRINELDDNLGIEEYFKKGGVTIIEWADLIEDILPKERLDIMIKIIDENKRVFVLKPHGEKYIDVCEQAL